MALPHRADPGPIRALECPPGAEYDEETFLYFLTMERARAERANCRLQLLLATIEPVPGKLIEFPRASVARLFDGLKLSLRDTDITGWYRQNQVAGAVLSAPADAPGWETPGPIERRVGETLRRRLPSKLAASLRVRVVEHGPRPVSNGRSQTT